MTRTARLLGLMLIALPVRSLDAQPPAGVLRTVVEGRVAPPWLALPDALTMEMPHGTRVEVQSIGIVVNDDTRAAALVGQFRNPGAGLDGVALVFQYVDASGRVLARLPSDPDLTSFGAGGSLPFRFALLDRNNRPADTAGLRLVLADGVVATQRPIAATVRTPYELEPIERRGLRLRADVVLDAGAAVRESETLVVSLTLHDREGGLLDVLSGDATRLADGVYRIELEGVMPLTQRTKSVRAFVEARTP